MDEVSSGAGMNKSTNGVEGAELEKLPLPSSSVDPVTNHVPSVEEIRNEVSGVEDLSENIQRTDEEEGYGNSERASVEGQVGIGNLNDVGSVHVIEIENEDEDENGIREDQILNGGSVVYELNREEEEERSNSESTGVDVRDNVVTKFEFEFKMIPQADEVEVSTEYRNGGDEKREAVGTETGCVNEANRVADPEQCLICLNPIDHSVLNRDLSVTSSMVLLSKIFKVTQTVYQRIDLNVLRSPLYCTACSKSLHNALNILRDIQTLENQLNILADDLKVQLVSSYRKPRGSGVEVVQEQLSEHVQVFGQLRTTFAQCWSECMVGVPRVDQTSPKKKVSEVPQPCVKMEGLEKIKRDVVDQFIVSDEQEGHTDCADDAVDEDYFPEAETVLETQEDMDYTPEEEKPKSVSRKRKKERKVQKLNTEKRKRIRKQKPKHLNLGIMRFSKDQQGGKQYPFTCQICGKGYLQKHFLDAHEQSHDGKLKFSCIICSKEFSLERHLRLHEVNGHKLPSTNARKVQRRRFQPSNESSNVYTKNGILLSFTCEHCNQKFEKSNHISQDGKFKLICDHHLGCDKEFFVFSVFRTHHEKTCPARPTELVHCDDCGKDFSSAKVLQDHKTSFHTKQYEFYCELCGLGLCNRGTLNRHMLCHTEEKKHQCPVCQHRFKRKMQLTYHMRKHNTELLLMCGTCGKTFANPQDLKNHELIHTNEKQFPCPVCNKLFTTRNYVYTHVWATHKKARQPRQNRTPREKASKAPSDSSPTEAVIPDALDFPPQ